MLARQPARCAHVLGVEQLEDRVLLNATSELAVSALYRDLFGRTPDASGAAYWAGRLDGGASTPQVVHELMLTPEFCQELVREEYDAILHRPVDPAGLVYFTGVLHDGGSIAGVEVGLLASAEYAQDRGNGTTPGFVTALFADALGRPVDAGALAFFTGLLGHGASPG